MFEEVIETRHRQGLEDLQEVSDKNLRDLLEGFLTNNCNPSKAYNRANIFNWNIRNKVHFLEAELLCNDSFLSLAPDLVHHHGREQRPTTSLIWKCRVHLVDLLS